MNSKTLLVFSCLLAAAQARPAAVSTSSNCAVTCSGRNFWTGYESGTTLKYSFEQKVELSSGLSKQKSVLTQVTGKASVEVHGDCEMVLTVDVQGSKASKSPSEATTLEAKTLPKAMGDALKEPLRFSFQDGRIDIMCPSSSETRASLNFKRGLLSQLHLSIDRPDQEASVREEDVLGNCWTVYKQLGGNKLEKTKDLSSCTNNFEVFPRWGVKMEAPDRNSQWPTVVKGTLKCAIELDSASMVIKENLCEEDRVLDDSIGAGPAEKVKVTTSLKLDQKLSSLASALFEVRDRSDLKHGHKTGDSCHDSKVWFEEDIFHSGNECLEKKLPTTGTASSDFKALAKSTIEELCEETKSNDMLNSTAAKYADLVKYMRGITSQEDFTGLFTWVKDGFCSDNAMLKVIVYSAIPSVGTRQSIQVILNQLKGSDGMSTDSSTSSWLSSGVAMMPHPTPDIISDVLEFTKKSKEEAMLIVSKDQPLSLSAVTGRYCNINTDCENNEAVAAVLTFFSDALGTNCSSLESQDDPFTFDYAFTALLSIGNIGRAAGGAKSIISCAENSKLSVANRAFALRSLRRFTDISKDEKMRLGELIKSKDLDSELRITAYQVVARFASLSFWSDERVISRLSDFMQDEREDQQVQRFIYSHLSQWIRKQKRSTDSYTVSNILREYERNVMSKSSLSGLQVSGYWSKDTKDKSSASKFELESNLIYSSKSMLPRFVNFNFTVESPLKAEAVNMFEFGLRMEGMEGVMEQVFNTLNEGNNPDELVRKRRQAASLELTEEQQQYKQKPTKQRLDFFVRKGGMELMHNNFDESILAVVPQIMKTTDFANVKGLAGEQLSSINLEKAGQMAGTMVESTVSIPTISGFPILMKKEVHYLSNIAFKQNFNMPSMLELNMGLELQPTASVHMARTVTVDSGFERTGVKYRTTGLSSLGVKLSLVGKFDDPDNIQFSYKVEPLKKQQKILELKTDVLFVQHSGPSTVIESPVVSPSEMTPVTSKCFTPLTVKLLGRSLCLDTNFGMTKNPLSFVRKNPGSFRLYIDKDDTLGAYEATLQLKREGRNFNALAVLGDQASPDRHVKFQFSLDRSEDSRKIVVELANPVLPIKWVSERKSAAGDSYDVTVDLKFGSTDYAFKGTKSKEATGGWKLDGNFYRKDKERQKLNIITTFAGYGFLKFLPLFKFDFAVTTPEDNKLTFNHLVNYDSGKFDMSLLAKHEMSGTVVTSVKSRLQCLKKQRGAASQTKVILYDTEVVNKNGKNMLHSFSAKVDRKQKDAAADTWESTLTVSHKFKHGVSNENSVLDVAANVKLEETIKRGQLYKAVGSGSVTYQAESGPKTATLKTLRLVLGESDVIDDNFKTRTFLLEYATELDGTQSEALVAVQVLPIKMWRIDNQCAYFTLKTTKTTGADSQTHALELRHTSSRDAKFPYTLPALLQSVKMIYASEVLLDATHKFYTISYAPSTDRGNELTYGHFVNVTTYTGQTYFIRNGYAFEWERPKYTMKISTTVKVNQETRLQVNQSFVQQDDIRRAEYQLDYKKEVSTGAFKIYTEDSTYNERRRAAMEIFNYLRSARKMGFELQRFLPLLKKFFYSIKMESGLSLSTESYSVQGSNYIDTTVTNGILLNFTRNMNMGEMSKKKSFVLYKEVEESPDRYRRAYKLDVQNDDVKMTYTSEALYTNERIPKLQIALSKSSSDQSENVNLTSTAEFINDYQRERQFALNWNVTVIYGNSRETSSKVKVIVDTAMQRKALNVTLDVTSTTGQSLSAVYDFAYYISERSEATGKKGGTTSELTIRNTFGDIPFSFYRGVTKLSLSRDEPFNFVFRKTLEDSDLINIQTVLNSTALYIGMKSDKLPAKEVSYTAEVSDESDGFKSYLSQVRFNVLAWDLTIKDKGKFKVSGRSDKVLFSTVYSGALEISGLEQMIGNKIPMDKLVYSGEVEARTTGEFRNYFQIDKVLGTTSENMGLFDTQLNYWPFVLSAQIKTPLWDIDHYGFNVSAGPKKSLDNGFKLKVWVASPMKQSSLKFWHTCTRQPTWFSVRSQAILKSDHLPALGSGQIESNIAVTGSAIDNHTTTFNLTTPFDKMQLVQIDFKHIGQNQSGSFDLQMEDRQGFRANINRVIQTTDDGTKVGSVTFNISPRPEIRSRWPTVNFKADAVIGSDYVWGFEFKNDNQPVAVVDFLWLKSGKSYPHLSRLSVTDANLGFEVKGFNTGSKEYQVYLLRSGNSDKAQWQMYYEGKSGDKVQTKVELTDGKVTSGSGEAFGKSITFSSQSDGVIDVKAGSTDGTNTITWNSNMDGGLLRSLNLKFSVDGQESCIVYKKPTQQVEVQYGSCSRPNTLTVDYSASNIWDWKNAVLRMNAEHKTFPGHSLHLLPGFSIPLNFVIDFKTFMDIDNSQKTGNVSFESSDLGGAMFEQVYDLSNFPRAMKFREIIKTTKPAPGVTFSSRIINYDIDARTVDVNLQEMEKVKFILNNKEVSAEIAGVFSAGIAYTKDASTGKKMIEMKGEWGPEAGEQQCVLRLWKSDISGGVQYALQFVDHSGKEISVVSDATNFKMTSAEFSVDIDTRLTTTMFEKLRSAQIKDSISFLKEDVNRNYTLKYVESFTAGGEVLYDMDALFKGRLSRFPSTLKIAFPRGYLESEFSYDFNPEYSGESYLRWSLSKFGENRNSYLSEYRTKEASAHECRWRDFSLEFSSPRRQFYLSESCKRLENGTIQTEVQAYLNKRNSEGILAVFSKDFTQPNVYKRTLRLTLPTRQVGYDRVLKVDGGKLGYNITVYWDMHSDTEKKVTVQFNREKERRLSGCYYYHRMDMTAPFLKNKISKEVMYERKENEFQLSLTHTQESADKVTLNVNGKKYWDSERSAYQKEVNISFAQQKGDVKANVRITVESTKQSRRLRAYTGGKFLTVFNIYTVVPSQSLDSHVRIRSVPFEEFTYACNHGATFSFRYYKGYSRSRLFLFVSNSKKEAAQLTTTRDWLMSTWEATLDTGKGYMDPKSKLSFPFYEPTTVMVKASAGLSRKGKKVHFGVLNGAMSVKNSINLWKPETVPAELDFFFVGMKLSRDNTMNYVSHWRIREMSRKSPFTYAKEALIDPWAKSGSVPLSFETVNKLLQPVAQSHSENIDTDAVLDLVTTIASTDIDSLSRWAAKARDNNEFLSSTIGKALISAFYVAKGGVDSWAMTVRSLPYRDALPSDLGILSGISKLADATSRALDKVPVSRLWSGTLAYMRYASNYISSYFSNFVDRLDSGLSEKISTLTAGKGRSIFDMVYNAVSSMYPVKMMCEKFSIMAQTYAEALFTADVEMASQVAKALEPYVVNTMAEIPKVYDFVDNLIYEINRWSVYFRGFFKAVVKDNAEMVEGSNPLRTTYNKNVASSLGLFMAGDYSGAVRKFFNTEANVIHVWRLTCDQACFDAGSFAAVNGTLYLPFDVTMAFSSFYQQHWMYQRGPGSYRYSPKYVGGKLNNALSELQSDQSLGGLVRRLLSPIHRTAEASEGYIRTFGGKELKNLSPCRYLLAHDFLSGDFSVYQTYTWNGRRQRGDLLVRFFNLKATITSGNELKLDGAPASLPTTRTVGEKTVEASSVDGGILVRFHSELRNAVVVKCNVYSCWLRVHPLYRARVNGAFGTNDGNSANDLHGNSQSDHMRLWTVDSCIMS